MNNINLKKYKIMAIVGIFIMAIGSYMACLANTRFFSNLGTGLLIGSIIIMLGAFSKWQP